MIVLLTTDELTGRGLFCMTAAALVLVLVPRGRATGCAAVTFLLVSFTDAASFATNVNWHESKSRSHDAVLTLVHDALVTGPRGLTDDCVHSEAVVRNLPARYGLPTESPRGLLTPDLVAADDERGELLLIEGVQPSLRLRPPMHHPGTR